VVTIRLCHQRKGSTSSKEGGIQREEIDVSVRSQVLRRNVINVKETKWLLQKIGGREENGNGN
jgi:hypothetical protein